MGGLSTAKLTLNRTKCAFVAASITVTLCISHPISSYALPIYPYLTFSHTWHVQSQWLLPIRCVEKCLKDPNLIVSKLKVTLWNVKSQSERVIFLLLPCTISIAAWFGWLVILEPNQQMKLQFQTPNSEPLPLGQSVQKHTVINRSWLNETPLRIIMWRQLYIE